MSLNLGLINLGLGSGSARARLEKARLGPSGPIRRWNEASAYGLRPVRSGLHRCDPDSGGRSEILRSCVPDINVMDPQALDPVDMDGKCVNPHETVKEELTTKTADPGEQNSDYKYEGIGAPVETIEAGGHELRQGLPILSSIEGKCTDPLIRSIQPDEQGSNLKSGVLGPLWILVLELTQRI